MKTNARKQKLLDAEHEKIGWIGLVRLRDVYDFECYLARRGWKPCVTGGSCLMRVMRDGRVIEVLWRRSARRARRGMEWFCGTTSRFSRGTSGSKNLRAKEVVIAAALQSPLLLGFITF